MKADVRKTQMASFTVSQLTAANYIDFKPITTTFLYITTTILIKKLYLF